MGYGEFVGGGSVGWEVHHEDGEDAGGKPAKIIKGHDKKPDKGNKAARFVVFVDGTFAKASGQLDTASVLVVWSDKVDENTSFAEAKALVERSSAGFKY
jgi:hypothetical protein